MFETPSKPHNHWPLLMSLLLNCAAILTALFLTHLRPPLIPVQAVEFEPVLLESPVRPKPERRVASERQRMTHTAAATSAPSVTATVGTARWRELAARGSQLQLQIVAFDSLPMLESYGVTLALDLQRPRGMTYLYRLRSGPLVRGVVPDGVIPRELELGSGEYAKVRQHVAQCLGARPRVFALYEPDLYNALKSLTVEALREHGIAPNAVTTAYVRVVVHQGKTFSVSLAS